MARFLVLARANHDNDALCYQRGDIVVVRPDDHVWGRCEQPPVWLHVDITNLSVDTALQYLVEHYADSDTQRLTMLKRRKWGVLVDAATLPQWVKDQIRDGHLTVTLAQIRNYIKNKITGETA